MERSQVQNSTYRMHLAVYPLFLTRLKTHSAGGWEGGSREREYLCTCSWFALQGQQELTQHCKATVHPWRSKASKTNTRRCMWSSFNSSFPGGSDSRASVCNAGDLASISGLGRSPGEGDGSPLQVPRPGKSHGLRSLVDDSPWCRKESDTAEWHHFQLKC